MKKFYGSKLPEKVMIKKYKKLKGAMRDDLYVDTQPELDVEFGKAISKVSKGMRK